MHLCLDYIASSDESLVCTRFTMMNQRKAHVLMLGHGISERGFDCVGRSVR
jgi:hypothetical protein